MMPVADVQSILNDIDKLKKRMGRLEVYASAAVYGTWTPAFLGTSTAGVFTYTSQLGYYFREGVRIIVVGQVGISAIGTPPVGNMRISGLPYTSNATYNGGLNMNRISNFNYAANATELTAIILTSGTVAALYESFDNAAAVTAPAANFTNVSCELIFSGVYITA